MFSPEYRSTYSYKKLGIYGYIGAVCSVTILLLSATLPSFGSLFGVFLLWVPFVGIFTMLFVIPLDEAAKREQKYVTCIDTDTKADIGFAAWILCSYLALPVSFVIFIIVSTITGQ